LYLIAGFIEPAESLEVIKILLFINIIYIFILIDVYMYIYLFIHAYLIIFNNFFMLDGCQERSFGRNWCYC